MSLIRKFSVSAVIATVLNLALATTSQAQTWTSAATGSFSSIQNWNFAAGPLPNNDATSLLTIQNFGTTAVSPSSDLNMTLSTLAFNSNSTGLATVTSAYGGFSSSFAFTGAGSIQQNGSGGAGHVSVPIVLSSLATGLTASGSGLSGTTINTTIASSTAAGAPISIALSSAIPNAGNFTLGGANTFGGGMTLNSGNLVAVSTDALGHLGSVYNTFTVNGGTFQASVGILNNFVLNSDLVITGNTAGSFIHSGLFGGAISGAGGVVVRPAGTATAQVFNGINTYTGATTIGQIQFAPTLTPTNPGIMRINSAVGSIMNTSAINVNDGGVFEINKALGDSINNLRVSGGALGTPINVTSGFVQLIGSTGFTRTDLGPVTGNGGATTLLANTSGAASSQTAIYIPNLVRTSNGTFVFSGPGTNTLVSDGIGNSTAAVGTAATAGNIFVNNVNGANPALALIGGGGAAGTTTISILPYGLGDSLSTGTNFSAGSGFVTIDNFAISNPVSATPNSVRLLRAAEYIGGIAASANPNDNVRQSASQAAGVNQVINSMFFGTTGATVSGGPFQITSGALASNVVAATVSSNVNFGAAGTGEAIVSVVGALGTGNTMTLSGALTGSTLTKSGHGILILSNAGNAFSSNAITVNAGVVSIGSLANLGIANLGTSTLTFNMHTFSSLNGGLLYTGAGPETSNISMVLGSGHAQIRQTTAASNLTWAGVISGPGALNVDSGIAGSSFTLSGANTYSGGTRIGSASANTFFFTNDGNLGAASGPITVSSAGTTARILGNWTTTRNVTLEGAWGAAAVAGFDTNGFNSSWGGTLTGASSLFKADSAVVPGVWSITSGNNPYTGTIHIGTTTLQGGTLALVGAGEINAASIQFGQAAAGVVGGTYRLDLSGATTGAGTPWRSFATVTTSATFAQPHQIQLGSTALSPVDIRIGAGTFGTTTAAGTIQGFGKLVKTGTGTLTLATPNTFDGGVEIWGGTLAISGDGQLGAATNNVALMGGNLSMTTASFATARGISLIPQFAPTQFSTTLAVYSNQMTAASTFTYTLNGVISQTGSTTIGGITVGGAWDKQGAGQINPTAINTYSGGTRLSAGTVGISNDNNLGAASGNLIMNGGTLQILAGSAVTTARSVYIPFASTLDVLAGSSIQFDGSFFGTAALTKIGPGTVTFNNDPLYFGTFNIGNGAAATGGVTLTPLATVFERATVSLAAASTATLSMPGLTKSFGAVNTAAGTSVDLGVGGSMITGFNNGAHTWAGNILGNAAASVFKVGTGALTITSGGNTFGGGYHQWSGASTISGTTGALPAQSAFTIGAWGDGANLGVSMTLDNTAGSVDRIADAQNVYTNNSALVFTTNAAATTETINSLRGSGLTTITMTTGGTLSATDVLTGLTRVNNGTFLFRSGGASLMGSGIAAPGLANILFANPLGMIGGPAAGTTFPIIPYATGGDSAGSTGNLFVTYGANGVQTLQTSTYFAATTTALWNTPPATNDNVRMSPAALNTYTQPANVTINSLITAGSSANFVRVDLSGFSLINESGAFLNTQNNVYTVTNAFTSTVLGIHNGTIQGGALSNREIFFHTGAGDLNVGASIVTSGGLTKSAAASLYLTNALNTYTGGTTVNAGNLIIDSLGAINDVALNNVTLGGGFLKYRGPSATLASNVVAAGGSATNSGGTGGINVVSGTTLTLGAGAVSGFGGLMKDGTGTLVLDGTNTFSGPVIIGAGALAITNPAALGTNSRILFSGSTNIGSTGGQTLQFNAPMLLSQEIMTFSSTATVGMGFDTNGNAVTLGGVISSPTSTRGIMKFGAGDLTLTAANTYTGATQVYGGRLVLGGANGSILASNGSSGFSTTSSIFVNAGGALVLDNTITNNNNRLPDAFSISTAGDSATTGGVALVGGDLTIRGNAVVPTSEVINRLTVFGGTITLENNGQNVMLTSGRMFRSAALSFGLIRGDNLGAVPGPLTTNYFAVDMGSGSTQLGGAGGAAGTPFVNIVPGFMADTSNAGFGSELMTYNTAVGFRPLSGLEYTSALTSTNFDVSRAPNAIAPGVSVSIPQSTWVSSLKLTPGGSLDGAGTLNVMQSTIMATGPGLTTINVPVINNIGTGSNGGYVFLTAGNGPATNLTVNSALNAAGMFKYGGGTLTLTNAYYGVGTVIVGQGTMQLSGANATFSPLSSLVGVVNGATLALGGFDRVVSGLAGASSLGTFNLNATQDGTVNLGPNNLTIYDSTSTAFSGNMIGAGGITKSLFSTGTTTFTKPQSFSGTTRIRAGTVQLATGGTFNSSTIDVIGGTLTFNNANDNQAVGGYMANRLTNASPVINLAGNMTFTANPDTPANITIPTVNLVGGGILNAAPAANAPTTITITDLNRNANKGTLVFTGASANLGLQPSPQTNTRVFLTNIDGGAPTAALVGGGGVSTPGVPSTTVSILPWAFNSTASSFMTYGTANGLRTLDVTEYNSSITAGATVNVRTGAPVVLVANTEVNSLLQPAGGGVSGAFDLTIASGAFASGSGSTIGVNTNALRTGVGGTDTSELVVFNSAAITIAYTIGNSVGLTKYGSSTLTLTGVNSFGGSLNINEGQVSYTNDNQLGAGATTIKMGGNTSSLLSRGLQYAGTSAFQPLNRDIALNSYGLLSAPSNFVYQINGTISGNGSLGFSQSTSNIPIYEITGTNTFTGDMHQEQGYISIASDANLGNGGTVIFFASNANEGFVLRNNVTLNRNIHSRLGWGFNTNGYDATMNGQLFGTSSMNKWGTGTVTFTAPNPTTSAPVINGGAIRLFNRGALGGGVTINACTQLVLDDTGTHYSDRIPDGSSITGTSGDLRLLGNSGVTTEEVLTSLTLNVAQKVTLVADPAQATIMRLLGGITRGTSSSILFRGTNLGVNAPGTAGSANLMLFNPVTSASAFTGGDGPAGNTAISIIAGAFGDTSATGNGTQLVTYDLNNGIRLLNATEYAGTITNGAVMRDNIRLTSSTAVANASTINALWLDNGGGTSGAGIVTITAGNILVSGTGNVIDGVVTTGGSNAIAIGGPGDLTINSILPSTSTGGLIKSGDGTLTLNAANAYTGTTTLASGTVVIGNAAALSTGTVRSLGGTLQAGVPALTMTNAIALACDFTFSGSNDMTMSGAVSLENQQQNVTIGAGRTLTMSGIVSANNASIGGIGLNKNGAGLLVLTGNNTYGGSGGTAPGSTGYYLTQTNVNAGELRVNGQVGTNSGTGGSKVVVNPLGTLSGTGQVIPGQYVKSRNTVDVSGTLSPGLPTISAAPGILTIGNAATPGVTDATVTLTGNFAFYQNFNAPPATAAVDTGLSGVAGTGNNKLTVNGDLNISNSSNIYISGDYAAAAFNPLLTYSFTVATATGTVAAVNITNQAQFNTTGFLNYIPGTYIFSFDNVGSTVYLNFTPIPEPATVLGVCAAAAGAFGLIRRRMRKGRANLAA